MQIFKMMFEGEKEYQNRTPEEMLDELEDEYRLIKEKKSRLSSTKRSRIVSKYERLKNLQEDKANE